MNISIKDAEKLSSDVLRKLGFKLSDAKLITKNLIDGEITDRKSHGLVRLPVIKSKLEEGKVTNSQEDAEIVKETDSTLLFNAKNKPAFIAIYQSLREAIKRAKKTKIMIVGIQDAAYCSGYIGSYARVATENDLVFIGFNNSPSGLVPFGAKKRLWGTDPFTVGIPTHKIPVILDMASSKVTFGDLIVAKQEGNKIESNTIIDSGGKATTNPVEVLSGGGMLPIAGHKGSGLAFIIEILAGALTGSMIGTAVKGGWGTSYILVNPDVFRSLEEFKDDVGTAINELKSLPKADGVEDIYFAGEKSYLAMQRNLEAGNFKIEDSLFQKLQEIINE